jgi:hypothetical protein
MWWLLTALLIATIYLFALVPQLAVARQQAHVISLSWFWNERRPREELSVKKLTGRQKLHNQRRQRYQAIRPKSRFRVNSLWLQRPRTQPDTPRQAFFRERARLPTIRMDYQCRPKHAAFLPPKVFSMSQNYEPTLAFLMDFSRIFSERKRHRTPSGKRRPYYAEFGMIEQIDPGAGLVLAAEIDSFAQTLGKPVVVHDHLWQKPVRDFFVEAGLFNLLGINAHDVPVEPSAQSDRRTLKYMAGRASRGEDASDLLSRIEKLTGRSITSRPRAYAAIAEALANVFHAYPSWFATWPYPSNNRWWSSGFWDSSGNRVGLQLYDRGAGIPATLPRQNYYWRILEFLEPERTPAGLIEAALAYGRTSTGQPGRGRGLAEMADWIEQTGTGFLRILSGGGEVTYRPGGKVEKRNHDVAFRGTLVEWEVTLDD